MEHRDRMYILLGIMALFITMAFNNILVIALHWYTVTNGILYLVIMAALVVLYRRPIDITRAEIHDYSAAILVLLAGTGLQYKNKVFLFLALYYALQFIAWHFWAVKQPANMLYYRIITLASLALSVAAFVFSTINLVTVVTYFGIALMLLILQTLLLFLSRKDGNSSEGHAL